MKHLRGSRPGGKKVFLDLDRNSDDVVKKDEINLNMDKVYLKALIFSGRLFCQSTRPRLKSPT